MLKGWSLEVTTQQDGCSCRTLAILDSVWFEDAPLKPSEAVKVKDVTFRVRLDGGDTLASIVASNAYWSPKRLNACRIVDPLGTEHPRPTRIEQKLDLTVGRQVEALIGPRKWLKGRVVEWSGNMQEPVWFVHDHDPNETAVVTSYASIRIPQSTPSISSWFGNEEVVCEDVNVPEDAVEWLTKSEAGTTFLSEGIWERSGVLLATLLVRSESEKQKVPSTLRLVGSRACVALAQNSFLTHVRSISDAGWFQERRNRRLKLLEGQDNAEKVEFFVHETLVGSVIGKQGENLSRVARLYKVEIRVFPDEAGVRRVRLYGNDPMKLKRARGELEYQYYEVPIPTRSTSRFIEWMTSESSPAKDLASRHNLHSLWFDLKKHKIVCCGLRRTIDEFFRALQVAQRDAQGPPPTPFKQHATPPTTAASGGHVRSRSSTRSGTPMVTPPPHPRPAIMDALPFKPPVSKKSGSSDFVGASAGQPPHQLYAKQPENRQWGQVGVVRGNGASSQSDFRPPPAPTPSPTVPWWLTGSLPTADLVDKQSNVYKERYQGFYSRPESAFQPSEQQPPTAPAPPHPDFIPAGMYCDPMAAASYHQMNAAMWNDARNAAEYRRQDMLRGGYVDYVGRPAGGYIASYRGGYPAAEPSGWWHY